MISHLRRKSVGLLFQDLFSPLWVPELPEGTVPPLSVIQEELTLSLATVAKLSGQFILFNPSGHGNWLEKECMTQSRSIHTYMSNDAGMTGYPYAKKKKCQLKLYTKINLK